MSKDKAILSVLLSALAFGLLPLFSTVAYANGFNTLTLNLFRSMLTSCVLFVYMRFRRVDWRVDRRHYVALIKVSAIGSVAMLTLAASYRHTSTGLATLLHYVYPTAVMVGSILFYGEVFSLQRAYSLALSVAGLCLLIGSPGASAVSPRGVALALISGVSYAWSVLVLSYEGISMLDPLVLTWGQAVIRTVIFLFASILTAKMSLAFTWQGVVSVLLLAVVCNSVGGVLLQVGLNVLNPTTVTILSAFEPITSLVVGAVLLTEEMSWQQLVGAGFILASMIIASFAERRVRLTFESGDPHIRRPPIDDKLHP